uniref:RNA helicase n=1 Tax=Daucus carota subsp. sativus TaxID=79200 RepID=A0A162AL54_DAUCS
MEALKVIDIRILGMIDMKQLIILGLEETIERTLEVIAGHEGDMIEAKKWTVTKMGVIVTIDSTTMSLRGREADMKVLGVLQGDMMLGVHQTDLTGIVADGNGKIHHTGIVVLVAAGDINLHQPLCCLEHLLMYDREEGNTMFDEDKSSFFLGDEATFKKETELAKKLQLLRFGAVRGTEVQTEFDNEEERKVILLVHDIKPRFVDGRIVLTKQAEPVMPLPIKDPTSDMAIISRKGSTLVREVHEKQSMNKSHQRFWELARSKLGDILGVEKTAEHRVVRENQAVVVVGETGSGKTTQLTQYLHEDGYTTNGIVGCTQPRRVDAMSVAKRYMTDGVLLRETLKDADLDKYHVVVMDEAQEKSLNTDVLFGILKKVVAQTVVPIFHIPGRTFPVQTLYSKSPCEDYMEAAVKQAMTLHVTSAPGDILIFMTGQDEIEAACYALSERMEQLVSTSKQAVSKLLILPIYSQLPADLKAKIFQKAEDGARKCIVATNIAEISLTVDGIFYVIHSGYGKMKVYNPRMGMDALQVLPVSRAAADQRAGRAGRTGPVPSVFFSPKDRAEESDAAREKFFVPESDHLTLLNVYQQWKSNSYRGDWCNDHYLHSKGLKKAREVRSQLLDILKTLKIPPTSCGPDWDIVRKAIFSAYFHNAARLKGIGEYVNCRNGMPCHLYPSSALQGLGYIHVGAQKESKSTMEEQKEKMKKDEAEKGRRSREENNRKDQSSSKFQCQVNAKLRCSLIGEKLECLNEVLTVVSMLSVPSVFFSPKDRAEESDAAREKFFVPESDHLTLLNVYQQWKSNSYRGDWCNDHYLHSKGLKKAREVRSQLLDILKTLKIPPTSCGPDWDIVRKAIFSAYFHNAARLKGIGEYVNCRNGMPCHLYPSSALYGLSYTPDYVVYHELNLTTKEYIQCATSVEPEWLAELGPMFFSVKDSDTSMLEHKKNQNPPWRSRRRK